MKKVISNQDLQDKMNYAINLLCNTVKTTLGPKGSNIIIDHSSFSPFITNDGVTIAQNIESEDQVVNTILELTKEASIKTNEKVGDGTTTTLVLLQAIFNEGFKEIQEGKNPIILKKELENSLNEIISYIKEESKKPTIDDLENIAITSSGSKIIGSLVTKAFKTTNNKDSIIIKEQEKDSLNFVLKSGYTIDSILASPYLLCDTNEIILKYANIILFNFSIQDITTIASYINESIDNEKSLVILAEDYSEQIINEILAFNEENENKVYLLKIPEYGKNKLDLIKDLEIITNSKIINNENQLTFEKLGFIEHIKIDRENITFYFKENNRIKNKIAKMKELIKSTNENKDYLKKRLSMFQTGIVVLYVGAPTVTERRERKMRVDDCLCAIDSAQDGIVIGSGLTLYKIAHNILKSKENSLSLPLLKALQEPFKQIMTNSGFESEKIINKIISNNFQIVFNASTGNYESIKETTIKDPTNVVLESVINATSIASILLTTTSLVVNEYKNNLNKINDFNDL